MNGHIRKNFAKRLRALRTLKYETAKEFADILGIDGQRYRTWELGRAEPNVYFLSEISRLLGTTPTFLVWGINGPHAKQESNPALSVTPLKQKSNS